VNVGIDRLAKLVVEVVDDDDPLGAGVRLSGVVESRRDGFC
jgi:hypothetical protein